MSSDRYYGSQPTGNGASYTDRFRTDNIRERSTYPRTSSSATASDRLRGMIERACRPSLLQPDLAMNLEIADLINSKKGNLVREAALQIVGLINSSNPHVSILAMGLLDICVKNCGYPFHLQISRKGFLNELVRKFPEHPPMTYTRTQSLVLEAIEEWRQTICRTSRYKDDFGYIRDMHRLLSYKGYTFPEINKDDAAVLNPSDTLQSAQELEEEEREAQSAKLEELLRRGTPADLQEANHLMSIMAGFRQSSTDYKERAAKELDKVRRKGEILEEMLANVDRNTGISDTDDVLSEIVEALKSARPKIKKMVDDEGPNDEEALVRLLALNDFISALIDKYDFIKKGEYDEASKVKIISVPGTENRKKTDTSSKAAITQSLIDIDGDDDIVGGTSTTTTDATNSTKKQTIDDLLGSLDGLSFGNSTPGAIALTSPNATPSPGPTSSSNNNGLVDYSALERLSSPQPATDIFGKSNVSSTPSLSQSITSLNQSMASNQSLPSNQSISSLNKSTINDTEWNFASSQSTKTEPNTTINILDSTLNIVAKVYKDNSTSLKVDLGFSNKSPIHKIGNVNFKFAVPKSFHLEMEPQSSSEIGPNVKNGITQVVHITNPSTVPLSKLKFRWQVQYMIGSNQINEDGTVSSISNI